MTICGTNEYMAPELLFDEEYGAAVDIFSFGMVLLEVKNCILIVYLHHNTTLDYEKTTCWN
jgi:serine/threonine protein kinase